MKARQVAAYLEKIIKADLTGGIKEVLKYTPPCAQHEPLISEFTQLCTAAFPLFPTQKIIAISKKYAVEEYLQIRIAQFVHHYIHLYILCTTDKLSTKIKLAIIQKTPFFGREFIDLSLNLQKEKLARALINFITQEKFPLIYWGITERKQIRVLIKYATTMTSLDLTHLGKEVNSRFITLIAHKCLQIEELNLHKCDNITDQELEILKPLTRLRSLNLSCCTRVTNEGIKQLAALEKLESLNLEECMRVTHEGLKALKDLPHIHSLNLKRCFLIKDAAIEHILSFPRLHHLEASYTFFITDSGLKRLSPLQHLRSLAVEGSFFITDTGLEHIASFTKLQELNLESCLAITNEGLAKLKTLTHLHSLNLNECISLTDQGIEHLKAFTQLQELHLQCRKITDEGLMSVASLFHLHTLSLACCINITDHGLESLKVLRNLRYLNLNCCNRITSLGLQHLSFIPKIDCFYMAL